MAITLLSAKVIYNGSPNILCNCYYEHKRSGANMEYRIYGNIYIKTSASWYYNPIRFIAYLNGSNVYSKNCQSNDKGWSIDFDTGWKTVSNKTSGTTPFYFTAKDTKNSSQCNYTSDTFELNVNPASFTSTPTLKLLSRTETSATFKWTTSETCQDVQYRINEGSWIEATSDANSTSGSFTINNLSAGTSYTIYADFKRKDSGLWAETKPNVLITTYSYPYLNSIPEFTIGNSLNIGVYNPLNRECTLYLIGDDGVEMNGGSFSGTSINGFNDDTWKNKWYKSLPSKKQGIYKVRLTSNFGNINQTSNGVKYYLNTSDTGFSPEFTNENVIELKNTSFLDISGENNFIKNHNSLNGVIVPMIGKRYANLNNGYYNISGSGISTIRKEYSTSNVNFELLNLNTNKFNVTAVDNRGFMTTITKTISLIDYSNPYINSCVIKRQNGISTKALIHITGFYTNWENLLKNNKITDIKYKIDNGEWKDLPSTAIMSNNNGIWTLNTDLDDIFSTSSEYNIYFKFSDLLETVESDPYTISTADAYIWKDLLNKRVGIGKKPDKTLDVNGDTQIDGSLNVNGELKGNALYINDIKTIWYEEE